MKKRFFACVIAVILSMSMTMQVFAFSADDIVITKYSKAVEKTLFRTATLLDYEIPTTPAFYSSKSSKWLTDISARNDFLTKISKNNKNIHTYYLDTDKKTPIVFITKENLSGVKTAKDAGSKLAKSSKVNVFIQAQIHGDEPAAGEGALYFISRMNGKYANSLLDAMNIYIVPCASPKSAESSKRSSDAKDDPNRDNLYVSSSYIQKSHEIFNTVMPEVFIDCHECKSNIELAVDKSKDYFTDVYISAASGLNADSSMNKIAQDMVDNGFTKCQKAGLRVSDYGSTVNNTISRTYYSLYGCASILIESMGINLGKSHYARRVFSHYEAVTAALDLIAENPGRVKYASAKFRSNLIISGEMYDKNNRFVLKHKSSGKVYTIKRNVYSASTAEKLKTVTYKYQKHDTAVRTRSIPTAYIIPKVATGSERAIKMLKCNGISYFEVPSDTTIEVRGYEGDTMKASLTKLRERTFTKGAYIVPTNQKGAMIICAMLEPDVGDTKGCLGSLVQSKVLKLSNVFRYMGDCDELSQR